MSSSSSAVAEQLVALQPAQVGRCGVARAEDEELPRHVRLEALHQLQLLPGGQRGAQRVGVDEELSRGFGDQQRARTDLGRTGDDPVDQSRGEAVHQHPLVAVLGDHRPQVLGRTVPVVADHDVDRGRPRHQPGRQQRGDRSVVARPDGDHHHRRLRDLQHHLRGSCGRQHQVGTDQALGAAHPSGVTHPDAVLGQRRGCCRRAGDQDDPVPRVLQLLGRHPAAHVPGADDDRRCRGPHAGTCSSAAGRRAARDRTWSARTSSAPSVSPR